MENTLSTRADVPNKAAQYWANKVIAAGRALRKTSPKTICELENPHKLKYYEGEFIPLKRITTLIRKILRERIWCKLYSRQLQIHFGYDYCMYIVSSKNLIEYFKDFNNILNIQLSPSPYL